jgi:drug/metabolite transporter (DMT)-like permease
MSMLRYNGFFKAMLLTRPEPRRMKSTNPSSLPHEPATWKRVLAFSLLYLSWGTTYFAIRAGVHGEKLPPALFGGVRVALAGFILLAFLAWRGEKIRMPGRDFVWVALSGLLLFVGGNGLITFALDNVPSGVTAVLVAATPLWMALMETAWPGGDRLSARGWCGLLTGLGGVLILLWPKSEDASLLFQQAGPLWILGSSLFWALGSLVIRYRRGSNSPIVSAAYQMVVGGMVTTLLGIAIGEVPQLTAERLTLGAAFSFFYLLIVGSLIGFVAFNWLLGHVRATLVGTYAYINPLIAILVGWLLGGEDMTIRILAGVVVILSGVALVRAGGIRVRTSEASGSGRVPSQESLEAGLGEVVVKCESSSNSLSFHEHKGNTIRQ